MKVNWSKVFSITASEEEYFNDQNDKIEFTGCKLSGEVCLDYLPKINDCFRESERFYRIKDYDKAINALESAYNVAKQIHEPSCQKCVVFFKATIIQSLENIHCELARMSKGIFGTRKYETSCLKAENLLLKMKALKEVKPEFSLSNKSLSLQPAYSM